MRRWLVNVAKNETILVVAAILALISCFVVPPDDEYTMYIHASTISQLICLMIVVCGFQRIGIFRIIGSPSAATYFHHARAGAHLGGIDVLLRDAHHQRCRPGHVRAIRYCGAYHGGPRG